MAGLIDDELPVFVSDSGWAMWFIRVCCIFKSSLSHHLPWRLLADLFIVVPGVNWSLPSMLGRHTVGFRTGTSLLCHAVDRVFIQVADACLDSLLDPGQVPEIKGVTR